MSGLPVAYKPIVASNSVKNRGGVFAGFICLSATAATVTFYDHPSAASGNVIAGPITLAAGQLFELSNPVSVAQGIYAEITGTTAINVLYQ